MSQVKVKWVEKRQFVGTDSSKHSVVLSSQDEDNATGMRPAELLLVALGACTAYDIVGILEKRRRELDSLEVYVQGEQEPDPPWTFHRIHVEYVLSGDGISPSEVERAIKLSEEKYCSVSATLSGRAEITSSYRIV